MGVKQLCFSDLGLKAEWVSIFEPKTLPLIIREYTSTPCIGFSPLFKIADQTRLPSPKAIAYVSAKTHISSFLAA